MKKQLFPLFLLFLSALAFGQSTAGPFVISSGSSACASISVIGQSAVGISVTGTFSATLQPEVTIQGQAATNIQVTPSTSSTAQATITAAGNYTASVGGYSTFQVCITAYTSGTATIRLNTVKTTAANGGTGGGGGGGGSTGFDAITSGTNTSAAMLQSTTATFGWADGTLANPSVFFTSDVGLGQGFEKVGGASDVIVWGDNSGAGSPIWGWTGTGFTSNGLFVNSNNSGGFFGFADPAVGTCVQCFKVNGNGLTVVGNGGNASGLTALQFFTGSDCAQNGSAANPSLVACGSAAAGSFSCATNASAATCVVSTTAVGTNSEVIVQESAAEGTKLGVTCNTAPTVTPAIILASKSNGVSFTINMPTITVNPACFVYWIVNK